MSGTADTAAPAAPQVLLLLPPEDYRTPLQARLQAGFPGLAVHAAASAAAAEAFIGDADVLATFGSAVTEALLSRAARLRWVHSMGTGVDGLANSRSLHADAVVTATRGIHGPALSEMALALMLALGRRLPACLDAQRQHRWYRAPGVVLAGKTVGIVGLGVIAEALARRCQALDMRVVGVSQTVRPVPGFDRVEPRTALAAVAAEVDYLVLTLPYDASSHHLVDAAVLRAMRPGAYLVNIARDGIVAEEALARALTEGWIAGAAVDVFKPAQLAADPALWDLPNLIVTGHLGGYTDDYIGKAYPILRDQLQRYLAGGTAALEGVVPRD